MPSSIMHAAGRLGWLLVALALLGGCATTSNPRDPFEPFNRGVYKFNERPGQGRPAADGAASTGRCCRRSCARAWATSSRTSSDVRMVAQQRAAGQVHDGVQRLRPHRDQQHARRARSLRHRVGSRASRNTRKTSARRSGGGACPTGLSSCCRCSVRAACATPADSPSIG